MDDKTTFYSRLAKAQGEIEPAKMDGVNPHFKSKYATLASLRASCMTVLNKHGFSVFQTVTQDSDLLWCKTIISADDGSVECSIPIAKPAQATPQAYGSVLTYARRYSLATCIGLVSDDDDDANAAQPEKRTNQVRPAQKEDPKSDDSRIIAGLNATGVPADMHDIAIGMLIADFNGDKKQVIDTLLAWYKEGLRWNSESGTWSK